MQRGKEKNLSVKATILHIACFEFKAANIEQNMTGINIMAHSYHDDTIFPSLSLEPYVTAC